MHVSVEAFRKSRVDWEGRKKHKSENQSINRTITDLAVVDDINMVCVTS